MTEWLTPREVGEIFRRDAKTIIRWLEAGMLTGARTPSGRWLVNRAEVQRALQGAESRVS